MSKQDDVKAIRVAEIKGEKARIETEIRLQTEALSDTQTQLDAIHPGERLYPGGPRVIGGNPMLEQRKETISQRLIVLRSDLAKVDEEITTLQPEDGK